MVSGTHTQTLLDLLAGADDHPALVAPGRPALTYGQVRANVVALAERLGSFGLGRGDRIAIVMPNGPEVILAFFAAALCGTAAPLNPKYKEEEFAFYYEDTQARALITLLGDAEQAHAAASPEMTI
ncbi:MAG TPA: AMP-binding protein, partial [Roseiflexaceae bacterium]|nr:AMP-binding protein [Roseiflexaceae bacterium]